MTFVSLLAKLLGGLLVAVVGGYLVVNLVSLAGAQAERRSLSAEATDALATEVPGLAEAQADLVSVVGREPERSWTEQVCDFRTDDAGWIVQNYRETCAVRSVTAWPVDSAAQAASLVPVRGDPGVEIDGCTRLGVVPDRDADAGSGGRPGVEVTYVDPAAADGEPWCDPGRPGPGEVVPVAGQPAPLGSGTGWLLVVDERRLLDEDIGCARWSVVFCTNPFGDRHAFGEPPA